MCRAGCVICWNKKFLGRGVRTQKNLNSETEQGVSRVYCSVWAPLGGHILLRSCWALSPFWSSLVLVLSPDPTHPVPSGSEHRASRHGYLSAPSPFGAYFVNSSEGPKNIDLCLPSSNSSLPRMHRTTSDGATIVSELSPIMCWSRPAPSLRCGEGSPPQGPFRRQPWGPCSVLSSPQLAGQWGHSRRPARF